MRSSALIVMLALVTPAAIHVQATGAVPAVRTAKLAEGLYALTATTTNPAGSTLLALVAPDGMLLVDTAYTASAHDVLAELRRLTPGPVRFVINTHLHDDHVGGNELLATGATVIAHAAVRTSLTTGLSRLAPQPPHVLPAVTFDRAVTIHFGHEEVRLVHVPAAHSAGDIAVHFVRANVVAVGDLVFPERFPYIDTGAGGTIAGYLAGLEVLAAMAPEGARFVPAHGAVLTTAQVRAHRAALVEIDTRVRTARAAGTTWMELHTGAVLAPWASWGASYVSADRYLDLLEATERVATVAPPPSVLDPLVEVLVEGNGEAAVARYHALKRDRPAAFTFAEEDLNRLGYTLLGRGRHADAIAVFRLNAEEHPDSWNAHDSLGEALDAGGHKAAAIAAYERSLALNPASASGAGALTRLRAK